MVVITIWQRNTCVAAWMAVLALIPLTGTAQSEGVTFRQDAKVDAIVDFYSEHVRSIEAKPGFRIQILAGTSREKAYKVQSEFKLKYPHYQSYLTYQSPYFKIRVGDFTEKLTAYRFLHEVDRLFPGAFLVEEEVRLH